MELRIIFISVIEWWKSENIFMWRFL